MAYRVRQEGGIFSSIFGMLIGIGFVVVGSPLAAWYAESQHRAEDFGAAEVVDASSSVEGYIVIEGEASNTTQLLCPQPTEPAERPLDEARQAATAAAEGEADATAADNKKADGSTATAQPEDEPEPGADVEAQTAPTNCVAVRTDDEEYQRTEKEVCGTPTQNQTIIRQTDLECDADGTNCEQCYLVEEFNWTNIDSQEEFATIQIGAYTVTPSASSNLIGTEEFTQYQFTDSATSPLEGDLRTVYTYLPSDQSMVVAGDAEGNTITAAYEKRPFVVSSLSYQGTLEALAAQDKTMRWVLRILSLLLMVGGVVLIFGPLTAFTNVLRFIPGVGKHLDRGFDSVLKFVAAVIGFLLWVLVYAVVLFIKNIFLIVIVLAVVGVVAFFLVKRGKKSGGGSAGSGPAAPTQPAASSQPAATSQSAASAQPSEPKKPGQ